MGEGEDRRGRSPAACSGRGVLVPRTRVLVVVHCVSWRSLGNIAAEARRLEGGVGGGGGGEKLRFGAHWSRLEPCGFERRVVGYLYHGW